ncbi:hypothetical protein DHEL01_v207149 [Diaporthe helianthi]|uniref:Uncharacterized protein n=1 Tax=Diaporthe helianthi TaxID=158607 RepID=A0A2P5HW02_DIAHE|nr:hypothetical protein DHEL01_v207149 [Diaporthe helianthi]
MNPMLPDSIAHPQRILRVQAQSRILNLSLITHLKHSSRVRPPKDRIRKDSRLLSPLIPRSSTASQKSTTKFVTTWRWKCCVATGSQLPGFKTKWMLLASRVATSTQAFAVSPKPTYSG